MYTIRDDSVRKAVLIASFSAGSLAFLLWLLRDVAMWVFAVLKALR